MTKFRVKECAIADTTLFVAYVIKIDDVSIERCSVTINIGDLGTIITKVSSISSS